VSLPVHDTVLKYFVGLTAANEAFGKFFEHIAKNPAGGS